MDTIFTIGLTYTGSDDKNNNYVNWLKGNDNITIVLLSVADNNMDQVKDMDGIVLSGGLDMHPKYYSGEVNYPNAPAEFDEQRDEFEQRVFTLSQQYNKPVLGVCRGMQLVNCIFGGNMIQDMGSDLNTIHRFEEKDKLHETQVVPGTLLSGIILSDKIVTNSAHHQAIGTTGNGLKINARSPDGIAEGIEWTDPAGKPFFLGVQWHPERMFKAGLGESPATKNIRERFIIEMQKATTQI